MPGLSSVLPVKDPVAFLMIVMLVFLLAPLIFRKLHLPGIVGLIIAGVLIGPHGFNVLEKDAGVELMSTFGLLYIMFLAGLDLNLSEFRKFRNKSIVFGILTFTIPLTLGFFICFFLLKFNITASLLVASMFSTHTLVAYPIATRLGINKTEPVAVVVGGTIITDTAVLVLLAVISQADRGLLSMAYWLKFGVSLSLFLFLVLWVIPRVGKWFFKNAESETATQYTFVIAIVFISGYLAKLAGLEPIVGAFFAGLSLNRLIPHSSSLLGKIEFIGHSLFIPFFLMSVGMIIDLSVLVKGYTAIEVAAILTIVALATKWLAAFLTQKLFRFTHFERGLMFGLSSSHAAATIAVIIIGYNLGIVDIQIVNGTILLILITCVNASFVTERAGRKLAIFEVEKKTEPAAMPARVLVPFAKPDTVNRLVEFAIMMKSDPAQPIFPLSVVNDDDETADKIIKNNKLLDRLVKELSYNNHYVQVVTRVDISATAGIIRAVKELMISDIILGWSGKSLISDKMYNTMIDNLVNSCNQMFFITKLTSPLNTIGKVHVFLPELAELEIGFDKWVERVLRLAKQTSSKICFYGFFRSIGNLKHTFYKSRMFLDVSFNSIGDWQDFLDIGRHIGKDDLLFVINARTKSLSYNHNIDLIIDKIASKYKDLNLVVVFPEQHPSLQREEAADLEVLGSSVINENILLFNRVKGLVKGLFVKQKNAG